MQETEKKRRAIWGEMSGRDHLSRMYAKLRGYLERR
jgi:hypothetical protein